MNGNETIRENRQSTETGQTATGNSMGSRREKFSLAVGRTN